jgi:hypothetical protein
MKEVGAAGSDAALPENMPWLQRAQRKLRERAGASPVRRARNDTG